MTIREAYLAGLRGQDLPALGHLPNARWSELHLAWIAGAKARGTRCLRCGSPWPCEQAQSDQQQHEESQS